MARNWRDLYDEDIIRRVENRDYENGGPDAVRMRDEDYAQTLYNSSLWDDADEAGRAALHDENERIRAGYNYSGGDAGNEYIRTGAAAPVRTDNWQNTVQDLQQKLINYGSYIDPYRSGLDAKYDAIIDRKPFAYDLESDPNWQAYQKQYTRAGQRAYDDALAQISARTGGLASSYAGSVAQQAYGNYMQQMTDKIPDLYRLAYEMYADEQNRNLSDLNAIRGLSGDAYNRWLGDYEMIGNALSAAQSARDYQDAQDAAKLYAYGDGAPYEIGSSKGQYFILNAAPGSTMTGGDGSVWTKNADGSVTITKGGQSWTVAAPAATGGGGRYYRSSNGGDDEADAARQEAIDKIYRYLEKGGTIDGIPQNILRASGLSRGELARMGANITPQYTDTGTGSPYARTGLTSFDFDEDEGIIYWNGNAYSSEAAFINALNASDINDNEKEILFKKIRTYFPNAQ